MEPSATANATWRESLEKEDKRVPQDISTPPSVDSKESPSEEKTNEVRPVEEGNWVTGFPLLTILGAICLVCFLMLLDTSIIVTAIPQITSDFHSLQDVGWYGSAYQLARCILSVQFNFESFC